MTGTFEFVIRGATGDIASAIRSYAVRRLSGWRPPGRRGSEDGQAVRLGIAGGGDPARGRGARAEPRGLVTT